MSPWWVIKWAVVGMALTLAVVLPISTWIWTPPELLGVIFGAAGVLLGWGIGAVVDDD